MNKERLSNGLRLITIPTKNTKAVTVLVLVGTGSKNETKKTSGISHFLEHMLFKGTEKRKTPLRVAEEMDGLGGTYNAFTGTDYTGYYAKVSSDKTSLAIDWVADIYLNSKLPKKEIEKERGVIKEEINMYYDNPAVYCQILFQKLLYGDQPAGWDIAGTKESVSKISREDLACYMRLQYVAENTVVVAAGNINEESVKKEVEEKFKKIPAKSPQKKEPVFEKQKKPAVEVFFKETDQTHFCLGVRSFNIFHKHRYTQEVIASLLGGMMSSRLFIKIRDEMGLAYYIRTSIEDNPYTGVLVTQAGVDSKKLEEAVSAVLKEYKKVREKDVSLKELKKVKDYLKGKMAIGLESSDSLSRFYGISEILEGKTHHLEDVFKEIDKVSLQEIKEASEEIFSPKNLNLAVIGPHKDKRSIENMMNI